RAADEHTLLVAVHHLAFDGASMALLLDELAAAYAAARDGAEPGLAELPYQFGDYAAWERGRLEEGGFDAVLDWWRGTIGEPPPPLDLPADRPRPAAPSLEAASVAVELPADLAAALAARARDGGTRPFVVFLAAWSALLARVAGAERAVVGFPAANREVAGSEALIGFFVNTLPAVVEVGDDPRGGELLERTGGALLGALDHARLPLAELLAALSLDRGQPLFETIVALATAAPRRQLAGGVSLAVEEVDKGRSDLDLMLLLEESGGGNGEPAFGGRLVYSRDLFDAATAERLADGWRRLLAGLVEGPERRLSELPLLSAAEREQILVEWNDPALWPVAGAGRHPREATIAELFAETAAAHADRVAVEEGDRALTYRQLASCARAFAARLAAAGVRPQQRVGVALERSIEAVVAILGVVEVGAAFVPLDPAYPAERFAWLVEDSAAPVIVTRAGLRDALPETAARIVEIGDDDLVTGDGEPPASTAPTLGGDALAYVMYTSGSTGRPKGVAVPHRAVARLVRGGGFADLGPEQTFLLFAPLAFDASTLELWGPLLNGGRLVVMPAGRTTLAELGETLGSRGVTTVWLTAGLFHQMVDEELPSLAGLDQLLAGGDVLSPSHVARVVSELPGVAMIDGYGPTENTTFTCCARVSEPPVGAVPVGRPIGGTRVHVLDRHMAPVPVGTVGELYAAGDGLARGYLDRPALTAAAFVPDPFAGEGSPGTAGGRLYRTGDLVRWRRDGQVDFLGRRDGQVKLRGYRVELGEIEAAVNAHPAVESGVVGVRGEGGGRRLVAWAVAADEAASSAETVLADLGAGLPAWMVPTALLWLDELPLNANGKVDRRVLPDPVEQAAAGRVAPRNDDERTVAAIWAAVLGLDEVGVEDDFFALGGHSLAAMKLIARLREASGVELPLAALFEGPTVAAMAERLAELRGDAAAAADEEGEAEGDDGAADTATAPTSFAQERLWFLSHLAGGADAYSVPLVLRLAGPLDAAALERALVAVVARHEPLRSRFADAGADAQESEAGAPPVQVVEAGVLLGDAGARLPRVDLSALGDPAAAADAVARREARRPFDLGRRPLLRCRLLRLGGDEHRLLVVLHHAVFDGASLALLLDELRLLYAGQAPPPLAATYRRHAERQRRRHARGDDAAGLAFWRRALDGVPPLDLVGDRPPPAQPSGRGGVHRFELPEGMAAAVEAAARHLGATPFHLLMAAYQVLLGRWSAQTDFAVGYPIANRERPQDEALIGLYADTLALRADLTGEPTFGELVARVRSAALAGHEHRRVPFERVVAAVAPRDRGRPPVFQAMLAYQQSATPAPWRGADGEVAVEVSGVDAGFAAFDLTLGLRGDGERLTGYVEYDRDLHDAAGAERLAAAYVRLLAAALADLDRPVARLPLLDDDERNLLLDRWSGTRVTLDADDVTLGERIAAHAAARPDEPALTVAAPEGDETLTWGELAARVERLAGRLAGAGVGPEVRVAVALPRGVELAVSLLAVTATGGAFVYLDPALPEARRRRSVEDSAAALVLGTG
ncbi:MAG TPA: amino acid adenylation domain-containing protein, partial [Thermoanaerobaculia bacterium]|nr:amino acid adenylation domain-containing protein [Thermoanaerobaculia bacterium]